MDQGADGAVSDDHGPIRLTGYPASRVQRHGQRLGQHGHGRLQAGRARHHAAGRQDQVPGEPAGMRLADPGQPLAAVGACGAARAAPARHPGVDHDQGAGGQLAARAVFAGRAVLDRAGDLVAQGGGPVGDPVAGPQHVQVRAAHPGPLDPDEDLAGLRLGQLARAGAQRQLPVQQQGVRPHHGRSARWPAGWCGAGGPGQAPPSWADTRLAAPTSRPAMTGTSGPPCSR